MQAYLWTSLAAAMALGGTIACGDEARTLGTTTTANNGGMGGDGGTATTGGSGGDGGQVQMAGGGGTNVGSGGAPPADYPAGPYGHTEGETFPYLIWEGYLSTDPAALATAETWTPSYTSLDLHGSGAQYALIHTTLSG